MSDRVEIYDIDDAPAIEIASNAGDIVIKKGSSGKAKIALSGPPDAVDNVVIEASPDLISVRYRPEKKKRFFSRRVDMVIAVPPLGTLKVDVASGAVRVRLPMTDVSVSTASGDVRIDKPVQDLTIKVASGDIVADTVERHATINSVNGDVRLASVGDLRVNSASGDVRVNEVSGVGRIKTVSGDVLVGTFGGSELEIKTMSGDARIGLVPGMEVKAKVKTLSGDIRNKITPSEGPRVGAMALDVTSFSGDITLRSAPPLEIAGFDLTGFSDGISLDPAPSEVSDSAEPPVQDEPLTKG